MCTFPSPGIQARPSVRAPMRAAWLLVATGGLALAGCGQQPASTQPLDASAVPAASAASAAVSAAADVSSAAVAVASAPMQTVSAPVQAASAPEPSRDRDTPTPLTGPEISGRGIGKEVSYYWSLRAPAGTLKLTATGKNERSGFTNAARVTLYDERAESLCQISLGNTTEDKTKTADCPLSKPNRLVLRVDLAEESIDYTVRIDGAIEGPAAAASGSVSAQSGVTGPGSTDVDEPTRLKTARIRGEGPKRAASYYYAFNAGPGELVLTIDGSNEASGFTEALRAGVYTLRAEKICQTNVGNSSLGARKVVNCTLDKRQPVILRLDVSPETLEFRVRLDGAYDFEEFVPPKQVVIALDAAVLFDTGLFSLKPDARQTLDEAAARVKKFAGTPVVISGHTDSVGDDASNLRLSQRRAEAVRDYFVQQAGIDAKLLSVKGHGEAQPIADNGTEAGRARNRRVEVLVQR